MKVVGSNPTRPTKFRNVRQRFRLSSLQDDGRWFESTHFDKISIGTVLLLCAVLKVENAGVAQRLVRRPSKPKMTVRFRSPAQIAELVLVVKRKRSISVFQTEGVGSNPVFCTK